jgi:hypothetical protein
MSFEMWAVPLSFAGLVGIIAYVTNEAVKWVVRLREKHKALKRLSEARHRIAPP